MGYKTIEYIHDFELKNHENVSHCLNMIMGKRGVLLAFSGNAWDLSSVRYALWLQRQNFKLATSGIQCAMIVPNQTYDLTGFYLSIPNHIPFPLLADPTFVVYKEVSMKRAGYVLLNQERHILGRWYIDDIMSFSVQNILQAL